MDNEAYYAYLFTALNRAHIPELKRIWQLSSTETKGAIVRTLITEKLPEIAQSNRLPSADTFEELYKSYKTRKMQRRVQHMPRTWVKYYLKKSDLSALLYALETNIPDIRDNETFIDEMSYIVGRQSLDFVNEYLGLETKIQDYPEYTFTGVIKSAILRKNIPVIQHLFAQKESLTEGTYEAIMEAGAELGDWGWIMMALQEPTSETLKHAAKGGHADVIQFFLEKLDSPYSHSYLLQGYVRAKNMSAVEATLEKYNFNADVLEYALYRAIEVENRPLISLILRKMVALAPYVWNIALDSAAQRSVGTLRYFYDKKKKWSTDDILGALGAAIFHEKIENIRFLLEKSARESQLLTEEEQKQMQRLLEGEIHD